MNRWHAGKKLALALMFGLFPLLAACGRADLSVLNPQGPVAQRQFDVLMVSVGIMTLVVVVVFALLIYVLVRFRRRRGDNSIPEQVEGNHKLEIIWTVIPIILLIILAVPTVGAIGKFAEDYWDDPNAVQVKVTAYQYWWEFEYPQYGITTAQELVVPIGKKIAFELVAGDVKHSFWIPAIGGKMDNNPGLTNRFYLEFPTPGVYRGRCAELCGPSHAYMDFKAKAVDQASFDRWVAAMQGPAVLPEDDNIREAFVSKCLTCHAVGDQGAPIGPNLTGLGSRVTVAGILFNDTPEQEYVIDPAKTEENIKVWLEDTQKIKPGNMMPSAVDLQLTQEQIDGIAKYLANYRLDYE
ncbi:MAG: cytochrome c oxidase subunit II [Paenibacillaceae bacterium ZCTH02-B3]|nr:MAG: cytochrome c oxidase subunit II [Paenibacillaceae bacterium ZCTH02-B3]